MQEHGAREAAPPWDPSAHKHSLLRQTRSICMQWYLIALLRIATSIAMSA